MKFKPAKASGGVVVELNASDAICFSKTAEMPLAPRHILVPIDFSPCSQRAVQYAIFFAKHFEAHLTFLHVVTMDTLGAMEYEPLGSDLCYAARKRLQEMSKEAIGNQIPTQIEVRWGIPSQEIIGVANAGGADLIIIFTHGHTGRVHAIIGSVAAAVTRLAHCPVLVLRGSKNGRSENVSATFKTGETADGACHP